MKTPHSKINEQNFSIMQRVVDGTLKIESIEEFEDILAFYPEDPFLYRKYSDLLLDKKKKGQGGRNAMAKPPSFSSNKE